MTPRARSSALALGWVVLASAGAAAQDPAPSPPASSSSSSSSVTVTVAVTADSVNAFHRMTSGEYAARVLGPRALLRDVAIAGFDQAIGRPKEWPRTWHGYGNRASARLGTEVIAQGVVYGVSNALDERPVHFTLCGCEGTGRRIRHALLIPLTMSTPNGTHLSMLAPVSEIGSAILVTGLHHAGFSVKDGLVAGGVAVLGSAAGAVAREFWPWKWRPFGI